MRRGGQGGEAEAPFVTTDQSPEEEGLPASPRRARILLSSSRRSSRGGPCGGVEQPRSSRSASGSTHLALWPG
jgi:hypothetical protein